jgi:hypothetical protein
VVACLATLLAVPAWARPPFRADDPEPVEPGKWQIDLFSTGTAMSGVTNRFGFALEANYGIIEGVQLHLIKPFGDQNSAAKGLSF